MPLQRLGIRHGRRSHCLFGLGHQLLFLPGIEIVPVHVLQRTFQGVEHDLGDMNAAELDSDVGLHRANLFEIVAGVDANSSEDINRGDTKIFQLQ